MRVRLFFAVSVASLMFFLTNADIGSDVNGPEAFASIPANTSTSTVMTSTFIPSTTTYVTTPKTTTSEAVTTTSTPFPDGIPVFTVLQDGIVCLILKAKLQFYVSYFSETSSLTKVLTIGKSFRCNGTCKAEEEVITIKWYPGTTDVPFNFSMKLMRLPKSPSNAGGSVVRSVDFEYFLSPDVFPFTNDTGYKKVSAEGSFFESPAAMGFTCTGQQNISMPNVVLGVSFLHLEAFRNSSSAEFNEKAFDCVDIPSSNKTVPIIVGVTAAILILLAVVGFFIGNRRRVQGYQAI